MLKRYKNQFVEYINNADLETENYRVEYFNNLHSNEYIISFIKFTITPDFFFSIRCSKDDWHQFDTEYTRFQPAMDVEMFPPSNYTNFDHCLELFESWQKSELKEYLYEKNQPDLLSLILTDKPKNLGFIDFDDNSPFDKEEKRLLKKGLNEIKLIIQDEFNFTKAQNNLINNRLQYLEEATERLGKTDWKGILISTIFSIITSLSLDFENAEKLLKLFSKIIQNLPKLNM